MDDTAGMLELIEQAPAAIAIFAAPEHRARFANALFCSLCGRDREELIGKGLFEVFPDLKRSSVGDVVERVFATGSPVTTRELELTWDPDRDGSLVISFFDWTCQPFRDEHGDIVGTAHFLFDVTELVRARADMQSARREAEQANVAKDEFLTMLGHELRNPLAPITTTLQLMKMRGEEDANVQLLARQTAHLTQIVDDLLDISRITRGTIELRRRRCELSDVIGRAVESARPMLEQRRNRLVLLVPTAGLAVDVDPDRIAQVVANLLTNAAKYSDQGSRIEVEAFRSASSAHILIRDRGVGIEPKMLEYIFEMFVQQPQALARANGGLGLGLAIAKNLVVLHGGRVHVHSDGPGLGSEFVVELPIAASCKADDRPSSSNIRVARDIVPKRVLVVDDNVDAARMLAIALEGLGHEVHLVFDALTALRTASSFHPDVALLDIGLPVMDGYELGSRLRRLPDVPPDLKLIAITGYGQERDRERSAAAGFERHFVKPVDLDQLAEALR